jgi:hypothetical protein
MVRGVPASMMRWLVPVASALALVSCATVPITGRTQR